MLLRRILLLRWRHNVNLASSGTIIGNEELDKKNAPGSGQANWCLPPLLPQRWQRSQLTGTAGANVPDFTFGEPGHAASKTRVLIAAQTSNPEEGPFGIQFSIMATLSLVSTISPMVYVQI
jgi:hypothetical protein